MKTCHRPSSSLPKWRELAEGRRQVWGQAEQGPGWANLGGAVCRGHVKDPDFAPDPLFLLQEPQKQQLGFESFCMLLSSIFPNCISQSRLILTVFVFYAGRDAV